MTQQQPTTTQQKTAPEQQQGTQGWIKIVMAIIFYMGLTVYLLGSIDHVAWFFHLYEPESTPGDGWAMVPSYGKAGALDLAIFFLAYVAATGQTADKVLTWAFTIVLSCVSLYANYIYAMFFSPEHQQDLWHIHILWGLTTTGWFSPIIASSYPLFAIIFMYLIERVISRKAETASEMSERLQALKEKKEIEQQIKAVTKGEVKGAAIEVIDSGLDVFNHVRGRFSKRSPQATMSSELTPESTLTGSENEGSRESNPNTAERITEQELENTNHDHEGNHQHSNKGGKQGQERDQPSSSTSLSGRSLVSVEDAAKMLLVEPKTVETLRNRGVLKAHPGNRDRLTLASIRAYDEKRSRKPQKALKGPSPIIVDANQPGLMIVPSVTDETGVDKLDDTIAALKENPQITDEELAIILDLKRPASARFWRVKAHELIKKSSVLHPQPATHQPEVVESL